jgi:hypothetical protein
MFDDFSDGFCPQCLLEDRHEGMLLNDGDYFECPVCRLQARKGGGIFILLPERGRGRLRTTPTLATDWVLGFFLFKSLSPDPLSEPEPEPVQDEADLRRFLEGVK